MSLVEQSSFVDAPDSIRRFAQRVSTIDDFAADAMRTRSFITRNLPDENGAADPFDTSAAMNRPLT